MTNRKQPESGAAILPRKSPPQKAFRLRPMVVPMVRQLFASMKRLSPRRKSRQRTMCLSLWPNSCTFRHRSPANLGRFCRRSRRGCTKISPTSTGYGKSLSSRLKLSIAPIASHGFNAKKFLSFQLAKLLDTLQNPFRRTYQSLGYGTSTQTARALRRLR